MTYGEILSNEELAQMMSGEELAAQMEFADNPEPRCPVSLLLDTSFSMQGNLMDQLNAGVSALMQGIASDGLASKRVELSIVTFSSEVEVVQDFANVEMFEPPVLTASGNTRMGTAINKALDMIEARKKLYKASGIDYYRPWISLITDGMPSGEPDGVWSQACQRVKFLESQKGVAFFAVGVESANLEKLSEVSTRMPLKLKGQSFQELFKWVSNSMSSVSQSSVTDDVALPPVSGWAVV
jgi:uncharacterized protein YegL